LISAAQPQHNDDEEISNLEPETLGPVKKNALKKANKKIDFI